MSRKYSIWKINGFYREKIYFLLSCLLIYPIFRRHHYEIFAQQSIEGLALLRHNLLRIVRYRQNSIAVLYIKYHKIMPKIVNELSVSVMEEEVNIFTFSKVEFEIEGILQLIDSSINYNHQMFSEYYRVLSWSEQEYNNVIQAYYSRYSKVAMKMKPFPWKYLFKIFNVSELELVH